MKREISESPPFPADNSADSSSEARIFAAWMGLALVAFGVVMSCYLFYRIGKVILDPRSFETQVDRWEFVVRGRANDAFPDAYETPDRKIITARQAQNAGRDADSELNEPGVAPTNQPKDRVEEAARLLGRVGSKSARPVALLLIVVILMLMVRILVAIINAGIRLAGLAGGEREYMKRIVAELVYQRNRPGD